MEPRYRYKLEVAAAKHSQAMLNAATKNRGLVADIYYPKKFDHYAGRHNDIEYSQEKDMELLVLIPDLNRESMSAVSGVYDILFDDVFTMWVGRVVSLPNKTRVDVHASKGISRFLVEDIISVSTYHDELYQKYRLSPYTSEVAYDEEHVPEEDTTPEEDEYQRDKQERGYEDDKSLIKSDSSKKPKFDLELPGDD